MGSPPADFDDELSFNELTFGDDSDPEQSSPRPSASPETGDVDQDDGYDSLPHVQTVSASPRVPARLPLRCQPEPHASAATPASF